VKIEKEINDNLTYDNREFMKNNND